MTTSINIKEIDITILGGGVLGISLAFHLRNSGLRILLIEKDRDTGLHASGKNAGMIRQLYKSEQLTKWAKESIELWSKEIKEKFFIQKGSHIIGREVPNHFKSTFKQTEIKINNENLPCVYTETDGVLDSPSYLNYLKYLALKNKNLILLKNSHVISINKDRLVSGKLEIELNSGVVFSSSILVNATGAWLDKTSSLLKLREKIISKSFARYIFRSRGWRGERLSEVDTSYLWDEKNNWYARYWNEDEKLISKCEEFEADPDNYAPTLDTQVKLSEIFCNLYPELSKKIEIYNGWHCFRTYAEDKLPIFGFDKDEPRLFWLGGFGGFGMSTSFASTLDASKILTGQSNVKIKEFSPDRLF